MNTLRPYVVIVDDPELMRPHRVLLHAPHDRVAERDAAAAAVAADWFDAPHGDVFDRLRAAIEDDPERYARLTASYTTAFVARAPKTELPHDPVEPRPTGPTTRVHDLRRYTRHLGPLTAVTPPVGATDPDA